jgi:hypothetical protein
LRQNSNVLPIILGIFDKFRKILGQNCQVWGQSRPYPTHLTILDDIKVAVLTRKLILAFGLSLLAAAAAAQQASGPRFGGPDAVENQLEKDKESWNDWKKRLKDEHGFGFTIDYTGVVLSANETLARSSGSSSTDMPMAIRRRSISHWDRWATSGYRSHHSTIRTFGRKTYTGASA